MFLHFFPICNVGAHAGLLLLVLLTCIDIFILFREKNGVKSNRILPEKLSNGDENLTKIDLRNNYPFTIKVKVIDEIPFQFQLRNFEIHKDIKPYGNTLFEYPLVPKERGEYQFGNLNIYVRSPLGLVAKGIKLRMGKWYQVIHHLFTSENMSSWLCRMSSC